MSRAITRRDFIKLSALTLGALALRPLPPEDQIQTLGLGRVGADAVYIYREPSMHSERLGFKRRDELFNLLAEIITPDDPAYNPRWYRVVGGFVHTAHIQQVATQLQNPAQRVREDGQLAEVTVPYSQSQRYYRSSGWEPLYRLYYQTVHWVTGVEEGPDGKAWYQITDERLNVKYHIPATHLRLIPDEELTPISPDVPPDDKRIEISLTDQTVTCYEGEKSVFHTLVSTGVGGPTTNGVPRNTPEGNFNIGWKMPVRHMGYGNLTDDIYAYELVGVPWCCFFVSTGVAFHGAYWHDNYGNKMSSGCVNMRPDEAKWLYRWTLPITPPDRWYLDGQGTEVKVFS